MKWEFQRRNRKAWAEAAEWEMVKAGKRKHRPAYKHVRRVAAEDSWR